MKIYQGVDIVEISRFKNVCQNNPNFINDIFTNTETAYCLNKRDPYIHLAGRFAAKEASLKALGIGISGIGIDSSFKEIEILPGKSRKPELIFSGWVYKISEKKRINQLTVSISHAASYAMASVILSGN